MKEKARGNLEEACWLVVSLLVLSIDDGGGSGGADSSGDNGGDEPQSYSDCSCR